MRTTTTLSVTRSSNDADPSDPCGSIIGLARVRDHLRANSSAPMSLAELALIAGFSKYHFLRAFKRAYGVTAHGYQMQLRLERARQLIAEGRELSYVAYDTGFADQSHLTRRFKRSFGVTPGTFARQLVEAQQAA
jgi:AraC-like DNA-binding protein